jgi:hypothetical protein
MLWTIKGSNSRLAKIGFLVGIAGAFLRVAYGPAGGWSAVEFWLLLFSAAAMNGLAHNAPEVLLDNGDIDLRSPDDRVQDNY